VKLKYARKFVLFTPLILVLSCQNQTQSEPVGEIINPLDIQSAAQKRGFEYIHGEWQAVEWPMPNYRPVYIIVKKEGQPDSKLLACHSWDLNHDRAVDMVEALNGEGKVTMRLYDFDFDGKIDSDQRVLEDGSKSTVEMIKKIEMR